MPKQAPNLPLPSIRLDATAKQPLRALEFRVVPHDATICAALNDALPGDSQSIAFASISS